MPESDLPRWSTEGQAVRLLTKRFTLRAALLAIALIGVTLGVVVNVRSQRLRAVYLRSAHRFTAAEASERKMEQFYAQCAQRCERSAADSARSAAFSLGMLRDFANLTRLSIMSPGRTGGYDDGTDELITWERFSFKQAVIANNAHTEEASQNRAQAALAAKRASCFSELKQKYERAALRPWFPVEPDPPVPE
jgi:hypothetical protein